MNKKRITALFCIFLIIMLPINLAEEEEEEFEEIGETLILEAKTYEPQVLRTDYMEQLNIPVRIVLGAIRGTPISVPEIKSVHVELLKQKEAQKENATVSGTSEEVVKDFIQGTPRFHKASHPTLDNLGFIEITLKKIPEEHKVPDKIDLDFKATITYEAERTVFTIGGEDVKELSQATVETVKDQPEEHSILGGRYYLRAVAVEDDKATIEILDHNFKRVSSVILDEEEVSRNINLQEEIEPESIRLKLEEVKGTGEVGLKFEDETKKFSKGEEMEGDWKIHYYSPDKGYVILKNKDFKTKVILTTEEKYDEIKDFETIIDEECKGSGPKCKIYEGSRIENLRTFWVEKDEFQDAIISLEEIGLIKLESISSEKTGRFAKIEIEGMDKAYYTGDEIGEKRCGCKISSISRDYVWVNGIKNCDPSERTGTKKLETGESHAICGTILELKEITTDKIATVTVLPGKGRGKTITYFSIHIPVEERLIQYTPEELQEKINKTKELIERLDKTINNLQKLVEGWTKVCLATAAIFTIMSFFQGMSGKAREEIGERAAGLEEGEKLGVINLEPDKKLYIQDIRKPKERKYLEPGKKYTLQEGKVYEGSERIATEDMVFWDEEEKPYEIVVKEGKGTFEKLEGNYGSFTRGDGSGRNDISVSSDLNTVVVPLKSCTQLPDDNEESCKAYQKNLATKGDAALYMVYEKTEDKMYVWWGGADGKLRWFKNGKDDGDKALMLVNLEDPEGKTIKDRMLKVRDYHQRGEQKYNWGGRSYNLGKTHASSKKEGIECRQVMSEGQCKILFNACDPVMCPPSRCDFSDRYRVDNVIQSGLVGSLLLCLPNIKEGVIMPVCLSGILAALKNIRSVLQGYVECLEEALNNDKSVGICDRIRSIFICEILWRESMTILGIAAGGSIFDLMGMRGGGEYLTGIKGGVENARRTVSYFTNDYATSVFAAYRGRSSQEIGAEICEKAIYGKMPILGEILEDVTAAQNPPQFTAYVEEQPLYTATGYESMYKLYYHIYAGSQEVTYKVFLRKSGKRDYVCKECSGTIDPENFVDQSTIFQYEPGYQEICILINNNQYCNFGKLVSSSFGLSKAHDYILQRELSKNIETEAQCRSDPRGYIPEAQVEKVCSQLNPGIGKGKDEERLWHKVGSCGTTKEGLSLGECWMKLGDLEKTNPSLYRETVTDLCEGEVCQLGEECVGREEVTPVRTYQNVVCCYGACEKDEEYTATKTSLEELDFVKTDPAYQAMYEEGIAKCEDVEVGTTDPFISPPLEWGAKLKEMETERRGSEKYNEFQYFKGMMYLVCKNCVDAPREFNELDGHYYDQACGENLPETGKGGIMFEKCKETCSGKKPEEKVTVTPPAPVKEEKLELQKIKLYDKEEITPIEKLDQKGETEYHVDIAEGREYQIEIYFSKPLTKCTISSKDETDAPSELKTSCKTKKYFKLLGDKINIQFAVESDDTKSEGMIVFTNKEKAVSEETKFLLCKTLVVGKEERMCISTLGRRCSDYCINGERYKFLNSYGNIGDCVTESKKADSYVEESKRSVC